MSDMKVVKASCIGPARTDNTGENCQKYYKEKSGLSLCEVLSEERDSDHPDFFRIRTSADNGKSWGEWQNAPVPAYRRYGSYEVLCADGFSHATDWVWNPVHGHSVRLSQEQVYRNGHEKALSERFDDRDAWSLHTYLFIRDDDGREAVQLIRYEDGADFDPGAPGNAAYFHRNAAYRCNNIVIDKNGDLLLALGIPMRKCFELRGEDNRYLYPTEPDIDIYNGVIMVRGHWNGKTYAFTPSRPMVISDLLTGRGMDEPTIALLSSGRIVIVTRGSNMVPHRHAGNRLEPGTPGFKWYAFSDDGGKTFTDFMPWHFDSGEVIYSSATISQFFRGERNGKQYWIGNIIPPEAAHTIHENYPRFPLNIVEIDETYGTAKKDTLTVIDTRRDGESEYVQLSNFCTYQDRETGYLHVILTKFGQHYPAESVYKCEIWEYEIELDEGGNNL